jgi:hypothetical protein
VILAVYEPLLLLLATIGLGWLGVDLWRRRRAEADAGSPATLDINHFSALLLGWWSIAAVAIYTWAGEKMPWLTIHLTLPLALLAAWTLQRVLRPLFAAGFVPYLRRALVTVGSLYGLILALSFVLMTAIVAFGQQSPLPPWIVPPIGIALVVLLGIGAGLRWGAGPAVGLLLLCIAVSTGLYSARNAYRLNYVNGDVPREMLVYTQTSPDVMRVVRELEEASRRRGFGLDMPIIYDNETVWNWYLRDFRNATGTGQQLSGPPDADVMAVLMLQENLDRYPQNRSYLDGFVLQRYPLRWWFPEDRTYRLNPGWRETPLESSSLLAQALRAPFDREVSARLWRFLMFRDTAAALGSTDFVVAVRPELANQIGVGLGGELRNDDLP